LATLERTDKARAPAGAVSWAQTNAPVANGVLFSSSGVVYVSYNADLWPFKSESQLLADGYGGTAAVPVPGTGHLSVVTGYSGA
jgi:hypothetical protein